MNQVLRPLTSVSLKMVSYRPNPLLSSSSISLLRPSQDLARLRRPRIARKGPIFRASVSSNPNGSGGSEHFWSELGETLKEGTGFDPVEVVERVRDEFTRFSSEFVGWSQWLCWKDLKSWDPKRFGAFVVYTLVLMISFTGVYVAVRASLIDRQRKGLTEAYMEALVPDPLPVQAPSFVFIDDIDAIAGKHNKNNMKIKSVFTPLLNQLDGEKVKAGSGRFSVKQAVIFVCATNMPEELDPDFVRAIDRHVKTGPPNEKQRVQIFSLHGAGTQLAEGVDFGKLVFRTIGYSGADIQNLVNEAAIMSVRKGRSKIHQEDIVDVLDKQLLEGMGALLTEDEQQKVIASAPLEKKRLLAVHEAGHIVLAHLFPRFDQHV